MLAVARSLMAQPRLLLLDEPSLGLAPRVVNQILEIVLKLAESGVSIVLVEQNVNVALEICDYAYVLENGLRDDVGPGHEAPRRSAAARGLPAQRSRCRQCETYGAEYETSERDRKHRGPAKC